MAIGRRLLLPAAAALALATAGCAGSLPRIPAQGKIDDAVIATTVDSPVAKYYLEDYLAGRRTRPALDKALEQAFTALPAKPTRAAYRRLSERFSVDLATLHLIKV